MQEEQNSGLQTLICINARSNTLEHAQTPFKGVLQGGRSLLSFCAHTGNSHPARRDSQFWAFTAHHWQTCRSHAGHFYGGRGVDPPQNSEHFDSAHMCKNSPSYPKKKRFPAPLAPNWGQLWSGPPHFFVLATSREAGGGWGGGEVLSLSAPHELRCITHQKCKCRWMGGGGGGGP